jgi:hypothetical protein
MIIQYSILEKTVQAQIYILYIRLMFGHFESESDIQQKAYMEEITQSRDATINLVWGCYNGSGAGSMERHARHGIDLIYIYI